ncbi:MAG: glycosyltransferase [Deltaproteobacteria bacterium]|nr:MAG: glycosyltransferase [Deltaproteobacteria bacterium]
MKKRIWASLDDYLPPSSESQLVGRSFANYNFFRALLTYAHFDEYHFFLQNRSHKKLFEEKHGPFLKTVGADTRIKLFYRTEMPKTVQQYDYTVFHQGDHIRYFNSLCHFRNQFGSFPVTAFIHSLSYPSLMFKHQEMLFGGVTSGDAIICSSSSGKNVLLRYFEQLSHRLNLSPPPVTLEIIPFGLGGDAFDGLNREQCRKQLGLASHEVIALCFGRFSEYDKMDMFPLLQAFQKIYRKGSPWRLILAGAPHSPDYVRMLELWVQALGIAGAVTIKTRVPESDKIALYRAANFFVSPSDNPQETFGLSLLEAMAAALPLIVSDFDGYRDLATPDIAKRIPTSWGDLDVFKPTRIGPLLDEALLHRYLAQSISVDIGELAASMQEFFLQPGLCEEMGKAARKRFDEHYDYRVVIDRLETFWLKLKETFSPEQIKDSGNPLFPDFFQAFSHYVTKILSLKAEVKRTEFAEDLLKIGGNYPLFTDMDQIVDRANVQRIILLTAQPKNIEEVINSIGDEPWKTHYQILWMLKHGLVEIC